MAVKGGKEAAAKLAAIPAVVRDRIEDALREGAEAILTDMRLMTPRDSSNPGPHAADMLTMIVSDDGLKIDIGLPTNQLAQDAFWFRFLDSGTKGGQVTYRRAGSANLHTMTVPARPALRIRDRALDGNLAEVRRLVALAIQSGIDAG